MRIAIIMWLPWYSGDKQRGKWEGLFWTTDDLKKCYGEAVVFFYKDGNLVDVKKEELLFASSIISTSFKSEEEFDQAKVTHRFWTLEN